VRKFSPAEADDITKLSPWLSSLILIPVSGDKVPIYLRRSPALPWSSILKEVSSWWEDQPVVIKLLTFSTIFHMLEKESGGENRELPIKLKTPRFGHVAMALPASYVSCNKTINALP
jgi:hypothetical protein